MGIGARATAAEAVGLQGNGGGLLGRAFLALCLVSFLNGFFTAPFVSLFPVYVEADLGRVPLFTAYLRSLTLALGGAFALVGGRHCDLFGLKTTLMVGMAGSVITGLVFQSTSVWLLTAIVVLMGMASGHWSAAGQSYLIAAAGARRLGLGGALYFLSMTLGNALGSLATGAVKDEWTFQQLGAVMVTAMAAVFALAALLLPAESRPAAAGPGGLALWSSYRPLLRRREVKLLVALRLTITGFWGMASLLLPLLVYRVSGSPATAAYYGAVSLAVASGCQLLTGALRDRYGQFWPLVVAGAGFVASALCAALLSQSLVALFAFGTSLTGTAWAISTLIPSLIDEVAGPGEKSRVVGLLHMIWSAAMVSGSLLGGYLVEIDPRLPFALGALLATAGTTCGAVLCRRLDQAVVDS
ncbi:MAG: MFS transporter [Gemmatimonadota bacterium]